MKHRNVLLTTTAALAGGLFSAWLLKPVSGARRGWLEGRLHDVEVQLRALEQQLEAAGAELGDRLRLATGQAVGRYVPLTAAPAGWSLSQDDVDAELPGLPRRR